MLFLGWIWRTLSFWWIKHWPFNRKNSRRLVSAFNTTIQKIIKNKFYKIIFCITFAPTKRGWITVFCRTASKFRYSYSISSLSFI
jgi:hypothetical protein